jgi:hypothetical protein
VIAREPRFTKKPQQHAGAFFSLNSRCFNNSLER